MYGSYTYHIRKSYPDMFYTDIFHPWCFYVIIKMLTYTYSCHFLLEVNNSYTRALIEICSPLTRKTTTGSNFYPFSVQWRDAIPPKFMKKVSSLTKMCHLKLNYRQIISLICPFYYFSKTLKYISETTSARIILVPVFSTISLFFTLLRYCQCWFFNVKLPVRTFSHHTGRISFHLATKGYYSRN